MTVPETAASDGATASDASPSAASDSGGPSPMRQPNFDPAAVNIDRGASPDAADRLAGRTANNPANRKPVNTRARAAAVALCGAAMCAFSCADVLSSGAALAARGSPDDPPNRRTAMLWDAPGWTESEGKELRSHVSNKSWTDMDRCDVPAGRRLVKLVWVYKKKRDGRLKSRLCVQGCTQVPGVDFDQTHCATMRSTSLRVKVAVNSR